MIARVLIVDDDRQNRELLAIMLDAEGFALRTAASGEEALALVALDPPDLVLLDVMMPGIDGYEVAAALGRAEATRHIPIIMITGLDDQQAVARGREAGAADVLSRPIDRFALCRRVRTLMASASASAAS